MSKLLKTTYSLMVCNFYCVKKILKKVIPCKTKKFESKKLSFSSFFRFFRFFRFFNLVFGTGEEIKYVEDAAIEAGLWRFNK